MFIIAESIQNPTICEVHSFIRFLKVKAECSADIHIEIVSIYGNIMNRQNVPKWCHAFSGSRTDVHEEHRTGRPSVISEVFQRTEETNRNLSKTSTTMMRRSKLKLKRDFDNRR